MKTIVVIGAALALLSTSVASSVVTTHPVVTLVRVPGNGIQPEAVVDGRGVLHVLYFAGEARGGNLFYIRSSDFGVTFSPPIRVNNQAGSAIATGTIRGGQLAVRAGRIHVAWNGSDSAMPRGLVNPASGQPSAPFLYARSNEFCRADCGQRWSIRDPVLTQRRSLRLRCLVARLRRVA